MDVGVLVSPEDVDELGTLDRPAVGGDDVPAVGRGRRPLDHGFESAHRDRSDNLLYEEARQTLTG